MAKTSIVDIDDPGWASFVSHHPDALPFHLPAWGQTIAAAYRMRSFVVVARDDEDTITAGLPLIEVSLPLRGRRWVALPFTDLCPPLTTSSAAEAKLATEIDAARVEAGVRRAEVRGAMVGTRLLEDAGVRHVLQLEADPDAVYRRFHPSQVHRNIRRAEKSQLVVRRGTPDDDLLDVFYRLHVATRQRLGVPVQPQRFFREIRQRILRPGIGWVTAVEAGGSPIAAALFMAAGRTVVYKYGASDQDAWPLRPNHMLFWHAIRDACLSGHLLFDFGRSDAEAQGLRAFKAAWGAIEEPLGYHAFGDVPGVRGTSNSLVPRALAQLIRHSPTWVGKGLGELLYRFTA